jgi:hypothetical protein
MSVSLPILPLKRESLLTRQYLPILPLKREALLTLLKPISVSVPILPSRVGLCLPKRATWPLRAQLKQLKTDFTLEGEILLDSMHLLAVCPNPLHLLHLKGDPIAVGDVSFDERLSLSY